jgi:hypothetical protein
MKISRLSIVFIIIITLFVHGCSPTEIKFSELVQDYNVVIMKHCYPASDVLDDIGLIDPSLTRQSLENYKAIYRLLRNKFDQNPDTLFIIWTLPPRHRLFEPSEGDKDANASRATEFSNWLENDYLAEDGPHPNIYIWDFRGLVIDPNTNFLKYEYELDHNASDSHPNTLANNYAGPRFAQFIVDSIADFYNNNTVGKGVKIVFLHHSTGANVYEYTDLGVPAWIDGYTRSSGVDLSIDSIWYPSDNNMPVHYYHSWLIDQ